jgi:hypothetical protein
MHTDLAERVLSLFTSVDRASAIVGDLTEARGQRGPVLFWLDVVRLLSALWRGTVMDAPIRVLLLAIAGCVLLLGPGLVGVAAVALFPAAIASPVSWLALSFCWSAGAMWTGTSLIGISPSRGMAACVTLAMVGETLVIALLTRMPGPDLPFLQLAIVHATSLAMPALLLVGGAIARRRTILRSIPT